MDVNEKIWTKYKELMEEIKKVKEEELEGVKVMVTNLLIWMDEGREED